MSLSAVNGSSLKILALNRLPLALGDITRRIDALVILPLGPNQIFLDNDVMSRFGAILDWKINIRRFGPLFSLFQLLVCRLIIVSRWPYPLYWAL